MHKGGFYMADRKDLSEDLKELRELTGMNRKVFAAYFDIPYRTITDWELNNRKMPEYILRMMEYQLRMEKLIKEKDKND